MEKRHILSLPVEIQTTILSHLGFKSQIDARKVCSLWCEIINSAPSISSRSNRYSYLVTTKREGVIISQDHGIHKVFNTCGNGLEFVVGIDLTTGKVEQWILRDPKSSAYSLEGEDISKWSILRDSILEPRFGNWRDREPRALKRIKNICEFARKEPGRACAKHKIHRRRPTRFCVSVYTSSSSSLTPWGFIFPGYNLYEDIVTNEIYRKNLDGEIPSELTENYYDTGDADMNITYMVETVAAIIAHQTRWKYANWYLSPDVQPQTSNLRTPGMPILAGAKASMQFRIREISEKNRWKIQANITPILPSDARTTGSFSQPEPSC